MVDRVLRAGLYLGAVLVLPGALIGVPILWWINHRNSKHASDRPRSPEATC